MDMLYNVSYTDPDIKQAIDLLVGKPFPLMTRIKMRVIGSQRFVLKDGCPEVAERILVTTSASFCNIGLRPLGLMIWFRVKQHTYVLALPYQNLSLKISGLILTLTAGEWWVALSPAHGAALDQKFIDKIYRSIL